MAWRNKLLFSGYLLIALWTTASLYATEAAKPAGYFIESAFDNFFIAPNRAVNRTEARHIFSNFSQCKCRTVCFTVIGCQAWSTTLVEGGALECRVALAGPATGTLVKDPSSTYNFFEDDICEVSNSNQNKVLTYDLGIMVDVALMKPTTSSLPYANLNPSYLGNDGDNTTWFASDVGQFTWWSVDLTTSETIFHVMILPRQGLAATRFSNIELYIGNTSPIAGDVSKHRLLGIYKGPYSTTQEWLTFTCHGVTGRFLTLKGQNSEGFVDMMTFQAFAIKN